MEATSTKRGPGRRHADGTKKAPRVRRGLTTATAAFWLGQHKASPEKLLRRANVKAQGRRQAIKAAKRERREALSEGLL